MDAGIIAVEVSTMPARHRERYSSSLRNLSTITPESCPPSNGLSVHDALESLSTMSRNNQWVIEDGGSIHVGDIGSVGCVASAARQRSVLRHVGAS